MKLERLGTNILVIEVTGAKILFSYDTPVAIELLKPVKYLGKTYGIGKYKGASFWSTTTTKHVNMWTGRQASLIPESFIKQVCDRIDIGRGGLNGNV